MYRSATGAFAVAVALMMPMAARAADDGKYPNWKGQWDAINPRLGGQAIEFDPTKPWGPAQQAPLTPEYQKVHEESMADQAQGGLGNYPTARCLPSGMPRLMALPVQEYVITPGDHLHPDRPRHPPHLTDGRDWPVGAEPTYEGYAIGKWIDEDGDGRYDVLEVETRGPFKGPRAYDATGLPLHFDNESTFKERFHLDKNDPNLLHDEIAVFDYALTRPWSVDKTFRATRTPIRTGASRPTPRQQPDRDRHGELFPERGRAAHARQEEPGAAGFAVFQADAEVRGHSAN